MTRSTFTIAIGLLCISAAAATQTPVTFESPCQCRDNHGEHRWSVKNDPSLPPTDASAINLVTPSDVLSWPGPAEHLTQSSPRTGIENNWYALTGRVIAVKVEADGDSPRDEANRSVIGKMNCACQFAAFSGTLPSMEAEIDCKLQSNSSWADSAEKR